MLRTALVALLVALCVNLSGLHVLEELDLHSRIEVHGSTSLPVPDLGPTGRLFNNIAESGDFRIRHSGVFDGPVIEVSVDTHRASPKNFRLHKLHRVFLI